MTIAWPSTPSLGQQITGPRGEVWSWDGHKWIGLGGTTDAPQDNMFYGRRNGEWQSLNIPEIPEAASLAPLGGQLRLIGSSPSNLISFVPFRGGWVRIDGRDYPIPATGITAGTSNIYIDGMPGQTLMPDTLYYVYLFDDSGSPKIEYSQIGHATSLTSSNRGIEIKQGDNSRSFIGLVYPDTSRQFHYAGPAYLIRSWFNRPAVTANIDTPSWTFSAVLNGTSHFIQILTFENEMVSYMAFTVVRNDIAQGVVEMMILVDNQTINVPGLLTNVPYTIPVSLGGSYPASYEGLHLHQLAGRTTAGTIIASGTLQATIFG